MKGWTLPHTQQQDREAKKGLEATMTNRNTNDFDHEVGAFAINKVPHLVTTIIAVGGLVAAYFMTVGDFKVKDMELSQRVQYLEQKVDNIEESLHNLETNLSRRVVSVDAEREQFKAELENLKDVLKQTREVLSKKK
jgi:hypothetical protein